MSRRRTYTRTCSTTGCSETNNVEYATDLDGIAPEWKC